MTDNNFTLDFKNMTFLHGDFVKSDRWDDYIYENGGIHRDCQFMAFEYAGTEVCVDFELTVSGTYSFDAGDWNTPPYSECEIKDVEIDITGVTINEYSVELTDELRVIFSKIVESNL